MLWYIEIDAPQRKRYNVEKYYVLLFQCVNIAQQYVVIIYII